MERYEASIYVIDHQDRIVDANDDFWSFGARNGWNPDPANIVGTPIWDYIRGEGMIFLYRHLHNVARKRANAFCFPLRCASPDLRRDMTMTIAPSLDNRLRFIVELDKEAPLHKSNEPGGTVAPQLICQSCRRIECDEGWMPISEAIAGQHLEIGARLMELQLCPECFSKHPSQEGIGSGVH